VETCLEVFGPDRCVLGSNWPVDRLFSGYERIMDFYRDYLSGLSDSEQRKVCSENAVRLYRL
jgi:predicted TIM-barrel fold metal-dependent hydrolase